MTNSSAGSGVPCSRAKRGSGKPSGATPPEECTNLKDAHLLMGKTRLILLRRRLRLRRQSHKLIVEQSGNGIATENALLEFGE